jgi:hypothetical protein
MTDRGSEGARIPGFKGNAFGVKASILDPLGIPAESNITPGKIKSGVNHCG